MVLSVSYRSLDSVLCRYDFAAQLLRLLAGRDVALCTIEAFLEGRVRAFVHLAPFLRPFSYDNTTHDWRGPPGRWGKVKDRSFSEMHSHFPFVERVGPMEESNNKGEIEDPDRFGSEVCFAWDVSEAAVPPQPQSYRTAVPSTPCPARVPSAGSPASQPFTCARLAARTDLYGRAQ